MNEEQLGSLTDACRIFFLICDKDKLCRILFTHQDVVPRNLALTCVCFVKWGVVCKRCIENKSHSVQAVRTFLWCKECLFKQRLLLFLVQAGNLHLKY